MSLTAVIGREMRVSSRQSVTYYLRSLGAAALLVSCFLFGMQRGFTSNEGALLFGALHMTLFLSIWIMVPLLAVDCISRERREGTLGLLFLTPLRPQDVVVAKGFAHGLRAMTLWLAVIPTLIIPFLVGGVGWREALMSILVNFCAIAWGLAAGILASSMSKRWGRACLLAAAFTAASLLLFGALVGQVISLSISSGPWAQGWLREYSEFAVVNALNLVSNITWSLPMYSRVISPGQLLVVMAKVTGISLLALVVAIYFAGERVRRSWQDRPPSLQQIWFQRTFCTPMVWVSFFKRWMRRKLERNPIGWLEQRTWTGRLVTWGWLAVMVSLYAVVLGDRNFLHNYSDIQRVMAWLLMGSLALSASASFRRERETGLLELLLVSPMSESRIISGRLGGLWSQFLPSFGLLLGIWAYFSTLLPEKGDPGWIAFHFFTFLTLPVIGLYFSLQSRNVLAAFLMTLAVGLLIPFSSVPLLFALFWSLGFPITPETELSGLSSVLQIILATLCWFKLHERLKRRDFPMERKHNA